MSYEDDLYWLVGYSTLYDGYINSAYALEQIPDAAVSSVPAPASIKLPGLALLFLTGLLRKKH